MTEDMYDSAQVDKSQTHAKSAKKIVKFATKSCQKMINSKFTMQWRIAKLISRQKWHTQCT